MLPPKCSRLPWMNIEETMVAQVGTGVSIFRNAPSPTRKLVNGSPVVNSAGIKPQV